MKGLWYVCYGGIFVKYSDGDMLVYVEGEMFKKEVDLDMLSVMDIRDIVEIEIGYSEYKMGKIFFYKFSKFFFEFLVVIEGDKEVNGVVKLLCYVELYMEYKDYENWIYWEKGLDYIDVDNEEDEEVSDCVYEFEFENSDEEFVMVKEKMKNCREQKRLEIEIVEYREEFENGDESVEYY